MNVSKFIHSLFFKTNLAAFRAAILSNDTNRICRILDVEREHIVRQIDNAGNTALLLAIQYASPITVRVLLEQGARPDQTNFITFQTPLGLLAATTFEINECQQSKIALELAIMLLDHGAYVDKPTPYIFTDETGKEYTVRETPLMTAVRTKNLPMATLFVERKANVNYCEKSTENRPIHFAITNGDAAMFDLLENAGASIRSVITKGDNTLLHWFCYVKSNDEHMSLLKKLINKDCDVNAENRLHRTPLMLAAKLDMINTCHVLISYSANIDQVDYQGNRAIDLAKIGSECFKLLQKTKQIQSRQNQNIDNVLWRKQILPTRLITKTKNESLNLLYIEQSHIKTYSSNTYENHICNDIDHEEFDTKYKRMWEKLLQTKQKIRVSRDTSLPRTRDHSISRKRDSSHHRINDFHQKDIPITVQL